VALQELRSSAHPTILVQLAQQEGFKLFYSGIEESKAGVGLLVKPALLSPGAEASHTLKGKVMAVPIRLRGHLPPTWVVSVYGTCLRRERHTLAWALDHLPKGPAIWMGDFNAITEWDDAHGMEARTADNLMWPWLRGKLSTNTLTDVAELMDNRQMTRVRGHSGTSRLDRILMSPELVRFLPPTSFQVIPLMDSTGMALSDHDGVVCALGAERSTPPTTLHCTAWSRSQTRLYKQRVKANFRPPETNTPTALLSNYLHLEEVIKEAVIWVNNTRPPRQRPPPAPTWELRVKRLRKLIARNPSLFFRAIRQDAEPLAPRASPPLPAGFLKTLMTVTGNADNSLMDLLQMPTQTTQDLTPPTDTTLRRLSRVPRRKATGPDGVPPYALYLLPTELFTVVGDMARAILVGDSMVPSFLQSRVVGLPKPGGDWTTPGAWRPICIPSGLYRLCLRYITEQQTPYIQSLLASNQYCQTGRTTAGATHHLVSLIKECERTHGAAVVCLLDVTNAFGSIPHAYLLPLVRKYGFPPQVTHLLHRIYLEGLYLPADGTTPFRSECGVRQGCPLSVLLFLLAFNAVLELHTSLRPVAFADDIALVQPSVEATVMAIQDIRQTASRLNLHINMRKTKIIMSDVPPTQPCLTALRQEGLPEVTNMGTHLGHPITCPWDDKRASEEVLHHMYPLVSRLFQQPLPFPARLSSWNSFLLPKMLYHLECLRTPASVASWAEEWGRDLLLGLADLPRFLCRKTLYSGRRLGLGLHHPPTKIAQRALDAAERAFLAHQPNGHDALLQHLLEVMEHAAGQLGAVMDISLTMDWTTTQPRDPLAACAITTLTACAPQQTWYTDGSYDGSFCAGAVIAPSGESWGIRPPGRPSSYRAEVYALALATTLADTGATIRTDSEATLMAVKGEATRVQLGSAISLIRSNLQEKGLTLQHVRGHRGECGNEAADLAARLANSYLPEAPQPALASPWEVLWSGEVFTGPHKVWAKHTTPQHSPLDIHPVSWRPIHRSGWFKWLLGAQSGPGYDAPQSFWYNRRAPRPCPFCRSTHNQAVHGHISFCQDKENPAVSLWLQCWTPHAEVLWSYRCQASPRDRFLLGKLVIPTTLYTWLADALGRPAMRKAVDRFHRHAPSIMKSLLHPPGSYKSITIRRLHPYHPEGWENPPTARRPPKRTLPSPTDRLPSDPLPPTHRRRLDQPRPDPSRPPD
jgi:hypothetical protein